MAVNQTWSMDFMSDAIARPGAVSLRIKCLTVADDFSHECVDITAEFGIGGAYVTRLLDPADQLIMQTPDFCNLDCYGDWGQIKNEVLSHFRLMSLSY